MRLARPTKSRTAGPVSFTPPGTGLRLRRLLETAQQLVTTFNR